MTGSTDSNLVMLIFILWTDFSIAGFSFFSGTPVAFFIKQHPYRRSIRIIILAALHAPKEYPQENKGDPETNGNEQYDDCHGVYCVISKKSVRTRKNGIVQKLLSPILPGGLDGKFQSALWLAVSYSYHTNKQCHIP